MSRRQRRDRIVGLLAIFFVIGLVGVSGLNPLEHWLGWSGANAVWMSISAVILLAVVWNFLGFFIDKDGQKSDGHHDGDARP